MAFHRLDLVCRGIECFEGLKEVADNNFVVVNVQGNHLSDFTGFGTHPYMTKLDVRGNSLTTYYGLTRQRSLQSLELKGNPIATHPFYRIMALMVVGFSLTEVDGVAVTPEERTLARRAGPDAAMAVSFGWLLDMKPRTPEAFKGIISECKRIHANVAAKVSRNGRGKRKTVADALREIAAVDPAAASPASSSPTTAQTMYALQVKSQEVASSSRTIERLSRRVATLEQMLREASADSAAAHTALILGQHQEDRLVTDYSYLGSSRNSASVLSEHELQDASGIVFASGISTRTNQDTRSEPLRRGCLQLSRRAVTVLNYMTRSPTFELKLSGSVTVAYRRPKTLILENRFGILLEIAFDDFDVLRTVFKLLFLLRSKPIPPLPSWYSCEDKDRGDAVAAGRPLAGPLSESSDSEGEELKEGLHPTPSAIVPPAAVVVPVQHRLSSTKRAATSSDTGSRELTSSAAPTPPQPTVSLSGGATSQREDVVDNIPDVPPLPSPGNGPTSLLAERSGGNAGNDVDGAAATTSASEVSFQVEGALNNNNEEKPQAVDVVSTAAQSQPKPPSAPPRRFQNLQISSSDSDDDDEVKAVVPPKQLSLPPSSTRPVAQPARNDLGTVEAPSTSGASVVPPVGLEAKAPPLVPLRHPTSTSARPSAMNRSGAADEPPRTSLGPSTIQEHSVVASSVGFAAEESEGAAASMKRATAENDLVTKTTPASSVRKAAVTPAESSKHSRGSVSGSEKVRSEGAPPANQPTGVLPVAPAVPTGRFANLVIDSDSDSDV